MSTYLEISNIKENDQVLIDNEWLKVYSDYMDRLYVKYGGPYNREFIEDVFDKITDYKKYVPKIRYSGSTCDVESYVLDEGTLVYLEIVGTENMVKSITSVLMQGRVQMNKQTIDASFGFFSINKAGNKRKLIPLDDGMAHSLVYHSPSICDTNFYVLIGDTQEELIASFKDWLEKSQPLPYPHELVSEIFFNLQEREKLVTLKSLGVEAVKVDRSILEDDYHELREVILEVCKKNGLIPENAKPMKEQFPLPKSSYLRKDQVQKIYDTLNKMPKTYELENVDIKPIGLKLFSPNMTLYVVEADQGCEDDEYENMHTQCFGYIKNESDPQMSEWGYINIPAYLELTYPGGFGFEQDLHFKDMYIDSKGRVGKLEELQKTA